MDLSNVFFNVPLGHLVIAKGFLKGADVSDLAVCKRILICADRRGLLNYDYLWEKLWYYGNKTMVLWSTIVNYCLL